MEKMRLSSLRKQADIAARARVSNLITKVCVHTTRRCSGSEQIEDGHVAAMARYRNGMEARVRGVQKILQRNIEDGSDENIIDVQVEETGKAEK
jgi:hypothetical protein